MKNKIITLTQYLITRGILNPFKIQKLLFFLRYEEIKNNDEENSFFAENYNFEAWKSGPVNPESYYFLDDIFFKQEEELEKFLLEDSNIIKTLDKKYGSCLEKWNLIEINDLTDKSQKNVSWINARKGIDENDDLTAKKMDERKKFFIEFVQ